MEGVQQGLRHVADRDIGCTEYVVSVDYHGAYHIMGTKWNSGSDNPTNGTLATSGNWQATYDIDLIPLVQLTVNSPLDTSTI